MFMGKLLTYYKKYRADGLVHPPLVTKYTKDYRKKCDIFQDFMNDYLEKTTDGTGNLAILQLHKNMKEWHKSNHDGKCPTQKDLRNYVQTRTDFYVVRTDSITGYRIKSTEDTVLDGLNEMDESLDE